MKYGPIICNPNSEEAKKLVGKKIVGCWSYKTIENMPDELIEKTLLRISGSVNPFEVDGTKFTFIREVIEENPTYRPYESMEEMLKDFNERFRIPTPASPQLSIPFIWVESKSDNGTAYLVNGYDESTVFEVLVGNDWCGTGDLLEYYTYLDGSPVGKEVTE